MSISLTKGSTLSLVKSDGSALTKVRLGLGWDAVVKHGFLGRLTGGGGGEIDLDASAIMFDANKNVVDKVWYGQLNSRDGSVRHSGDNLTGDGDGDDEQIVVDLNKIHSGVQSVVLVITSYSRQTFDQIANVFARVVDLTNGENEVTRYNLADGGNHTAKIVAVIARSGDSWTIKAVGNPANGRTVNDVLADAQAVL